MKLSHEEGRLFFKLYPALMCYASKKLKGVKEIPADFAQYLTVEPERLLKVRDAIHAHKRLIDDFVKENPANLALNELVIVADWKNAVVGSFYIFRYLTNYTIFLVDRSPPKAYGVIAVADPFQEIIGQNLPVLTQAVLLPFKGKIINDGLLFSYPISFGPGIRRRLKETFKRAKENYGIITSLPVKGNQ